MNIYIVELYWFSIGSTIWRQCEHFKHRQLGAHEQNKVRWWLMQRVCSDGNKMEWTGYACTSVCRSPCAHSWSTSCWCCSVVCYLATSVVSAWDVSFYWIFAKLQFQLWKGVYFGRIENYRRHWVVSMVSSAQQGAAAPCVFFQFYCILWMDCPTFASEIIINYVSFMRRDKNWTKNFFKLKIGIFGADSSSASVSASNVWSDRMVVLGAGPLWTCMLERMICQTTRIRVSVAKRAGAVQNTTVDACH